MKIRFTPLAYKDIDSVYNYLAKDDSNIAQVALDRIENLIDHLIFHPELGKQGRVKGTRELIIPKVPFIVVYKVEDDFITIIAVIHVSKRWSNN